MTQPIVELTVPVDAKRFSELNSMFTLPPEIRGPYTLSSHVCEFASEFTENDLASPRTETGHLTYKPLGVEVEKRTANEMVLKDVGYRGEIVEGMQRRLVYKLDPMAEPHDPFRASRKRLGEAFDGPPVPQRKTPAKGSL